MLFYLLIFTVAMGVVLVATMGVIRISKSLGILDLPGVRRVHKWPVPRIGGVAILAGMLLGGLFCLVPEILRDDPFPYPLVKVLVLLGSGLIIFFLGLYDDVRGASARTKFIIQVLAALAVCSAGFLIQKVRLPFGLTFEGGWYSWPVTVIWIVAITNAVNLIDGVDGLAAGVSAIAAAMLAVVAINAGHMMVAYAAIGLSGGLVGFLWFNRYPAKIHMGDCGSLFVGFFLGAGSVIVSSGATRFAELAILFIALGIPILDMFYCVFRRTLDRRSPFSPDKEHIHHTMLEIGMGPRRIAFTIWGVTLLVSAGSLFMFSFTKQRHQFGIFCLAIIALITFFRAIGHFRLRTTMGAMRRKKEINEERKEIRQRFEHLLLHFREAETFTDWWQVVCLAGTELDFSRITMPVDRRDGTTEMLTWQRAQVPEGEVVTMSFPVRQRRTGNCLRAEIEVPVANNLESVGRRLIHFSRLLDERSIADLPVKD